MSTNSYYSRKLRKCKQIKGNESHRNLEPSYFGTTSKGLGSGNVMMLPPCGKVVASGFSDHLADGGMPGKALKVAALGMLSLCIY